MTFGIKSDIMATSKTMSANTAYTTRAALTGEKQEMKVLIIGHGKVGSAIAENLAQDNNDVTVIENRSEVMASLPQGLPYKVIKGNGACIEILREAGIENADVLIAVSPHDELNVIACVIGKKLGAKYTVARLRNPEYSSQIVFMHNEFGLTFSINPDNSAAEEISGIVRFPSAAKIESFSNGLLNLVEYTIPQESSLIDIPLADIYGKYKVKVLICFVERENEVFIPTGATCLQAGDRIALAADTQSIISFFGLLSAKKKPIKAVTIAGGGRIPHYLIKSLQALDINITVIEKSPRLVEKLRAAYDKINIVNADPTDKEVLKTADVGSADAFVSLTETDEENVIMAMHAKALGCAKIIAVTDQPSYSGILKDSGIDSIIMPKLLTADRILQFVRSKENARGSGVETLYKLADGKVEAIAFKVKKAADFIGKPLKDLSLKKDLLIGAVIRKNSTIIPNGNDTMELGDEVVVITTQHGLKDVSEIIR